MPFLRRVGLLGHSASTGGMKGGKRSLLVLKTERLASVEMNAHHASKSTRDHRHIYKSWKRIRRKPGWEDEGDDDYDPGFTDPACVGAGEITPPSPDPFPQPPIEPVSRQSCKLAGRVLFDSTEAIVARLDRSPRASRASRDYSQSSELTNPARINVLPLVLPYARGGTTATQLSSTSTPDSINAAAYWRKHGWITSVFRTSR
ncbi:hypothetical protein BDM02DRAFT_3112875 [Thelephora ganbajun]|uniref:Uncharacterized protein n=1 Tax=Thelephora ganbajun TaxID=370292 RepID=A0ACB6ZK08_THEGA|nr:hypothetical protein BDM02DRAFT_3112875 [Thelephora ganbajun]